MSGQQGQALGQSATNAAQSYQFPMQGAGGAPQPMGVNVPMNPNVQRMPGGFGLSPQLLAQIAALQSRSPHFNPQPVPQARAFPVFQGQYQNPYQRNIGGPGSGGSGGGGPGAGGPGGSGGS